MTDIRMYVLTSRAFYAPEDPMYRPLQVGSALHEDLGYERDDTGDNISDQYDRFCELTGFYWIWKNVKCDVVGISLENRYFCYYEDVIRKYRIESLLNEGYDVILPETESPCNMLIAKKEIFDRYCEWLFGILLKKEKQDDQREGKDKNDYLSFGAQIEKQFFLDNEYRTVEATVEETDLHLYREAEEAVIKKKEILKKMLNPLILSYAAGNPIDLLPLHPGSYNFHGRLPVWICWWQGEEAMPPIVKACFDSLRENLPKERTEIILITFENAYDFVRFPDFIEEKYRNGIISLTHLSDILRMSLLTLYGGLWLDATYLLTSAPDEALIIDRDFYTQCFKELRYTDEIVVKGRWTTNLMRTNAWNPLTRFVLNGFYCYFAANNTILDYFLMDYLTLVAYEEIPTVKEMIDRCPPSQPELYSMEILLNEAFDEEKWKRLTKETSFFKLSYKHIFEDRTKEGKMTYYAKIMEQYGRDRNDH